mgnify:CR=1 FL=1
MLYLCYGVFLLFMEFHFLAKMVDGTEGKRFAFMRRLHVRVIEWSLRPSASMRAECLFLRARAFDKQLQNFASTSKRAQI